MVDLGLWVRLGVTSPGQPGVAGLENQWLEVVSFGS